MFVYRKKRNIALFILGNIIGLCAMITLVAFFYLSTFLSSSHLTFSELKTIVSTGYSQRKQFENKQITFLILGLDQRDDSFESTLLTDTLMLASLDLTNSQLTMLAIPRDLWINELKTKVNALYFYGEERDDTTGPEFTKEELERITGAPIDYWLLMNYNDLPKLVDLVGGISVDVPQSFTDNEYPNPDYLIDQNNQIYQTIQFNKGLQHMNGNRALAYVRSRHSESEEGSDISRSKRQMHVFQAVISKLSARSLVTNPGQLGTLYRFWKDSVDTDASDDTLISIGLNLQPTTIAIESKAIPVGTATDPEAVLVNPPVSKYGLWVWEPKDPSWKELREFIAKNF